MRAASIDIGSNSILLLIAELEPHFKILHREFSVTGLGRGIDETGGFIPKAMEESLEVLRDYAKKIQEYKVQESHVIVTATEASRVAKNSADFFQIVREETRLGVQLISGDQEAYYSSLGVVANSDIEGQIVIMDIGGASTEFISVLSRPFEVLESTSLPLGSVRWTEWEKQRKLQDQLCKINFSELDRFKSDKIICVAGTMTSVGNMILGSKNFDEQDLQGFEFSIEKLRKLALEIAPLSQKELLEAFPFLKKRVSVIKGGISLALSLLEKIGARNVQISTYGLMYGSILSVKNNKE